MALVRILGDQAVVSGAGFLRGILLARLLGLAEFGIFTLFWTFWLLCASIQQSLILSPMLSLGPQTPHPEREAYYSTLFIQQTLLTGVLAASAYLGLRVFFPAYDALPFTIFLIAAQLYEFFRRHLLATGSETRALVTDSLVYGTQVVLIAALLSLQSSDSIRVDQIFWFLAAAVLAGILGLGRAFPLSGVSRKRLLAGLLGSWAFSKWLLAVAILQWIAGNYLLVSAVLLLGTPAAGAIKAAQNVMGIVYVLFQGFENYFPVAIATQVTREGASAVSNWMRSKGVLPIAAISALAALLGGFSEFWMGLIYGAEYAAHARLLSAFAVVSVFSAVAILLNAGLRSLGRTRPIFEAYAACAVFNLMAARPLIESFGLLGVPIGVGLNQLLVILWTRFSLNVFLRRAA